jgi:hypothetical protein
MRTCRRALSREFAHAFIARNFAGRDGEHFGGQGDVR